ncbi:FtsK/SpoIIIE family DNA translocase [Rhizobium alvei]|uniref:DNA translocase FtsK n=1 Tax=Rhizobium alvei TaxID=1132659 RepID=A0ABT8YMZ5_9HYPH|nr:DNA translocase FtsK [Rhizobium alvei]MDO6964994.1 DNA translocase FtsK [Rhizobium alvei]
MARSISTDYQAHSVRFTVTSFLWRQAKVILGIGLIGLLGLAIAALSTWSVLDPSYSNATSREPDNILGTGGAYFADLMMQFFGLGAVLALLPVFSWALMMILNVPVYRPLQRAGGWFAGSVLASAALSCFAPPATWPIPNGLGGVFGDLILKFPALFLGSYPEGIAAIVIGSVLSVPALGLLAFAANLIATSEPPRREVPREGPVMPIRTVRTQAAVPEPEEEEERDSPFAFVAGYATHAWYSAQARLRRLTGIKARQPASRHFEAPYDLHDDEFGLRSEEPTEDYDDDIDIDDGEAPVVMADPRPVQAAQPATRRIVTAPPIATHDFDDDPPFDIDEPLPSGILPEDDDDGWMVKPEIRSPRRPAPSLRAPVEAPVPPPVAGAMPQPARPGAMVARPKPAAVEPPRQERIAAPRRDGGFDLPPIELLSEPKKAAKDMSLSNEALEHNARILEGVLDDFGVKGSILHVHPGPVVTLYELEPAPGIKSSRVIGLADDIARSMSAIAARVAVVPGRNAIGIELPNKNREMVFLREMFASRDFDGSKAKLAVALGKTIGGDPVIADLAKMPHLLVAGTTGSGKSVAINTMILSLLYRMTPEQCRLIMIDPKMLELSVYDGIPHLLSPVVTDPKKAVVALKWTVREMEERYKKMSKIGVRNIDGFNTRVNQALEKGEVITRTVQTGFDRQTGEAIYETEEFDLQPLPYIVVIIDEMADLMMVAGKDIEGAVQRLAQMARAAGIHVIMATQRPSVDVITGTIKANFPTRISFQVTSKIDSRTILGEQGAEQLLGMGDMLYMAGGGRIQRVHGPFVSDNEVEEVVAFLKTQGSPQYLDAITADEDEDGEGGGGGPAGTSNLAESDDPYDQAVAVVLRDGKASTSYIQRRLGIGYNRAASIIERMEQEGIVGPANHAGKREILVPTEEDVLAR